MLFEKVNKKNILYDKSVEVRVLAERRLGRRVKVLLLVLVRDRVLVTEDEVDLSNNECASSSPRPNTPPCSQDKSSQGQT